MTILVQLENYYRKRGILSTNFRCKHAAECQGDLPSAPVDATRLCEVRNKFTEAHSAYVGVRYGDIFPRLLFVQLDLGTVLSDKDPGYNLASPESRTPEGLRKMRELMSERVMSGKAPMSPTVKGTNKLAAAILRGCSPEIQEDMWVSRFYARVNAVKCTMNKKRREQADDRLYDNCRERDYLRKEIEILSPDIIISMGEQAKKTVESVFHVSSEWTREQKVKLRDGKEAVWAPIYHPSSYGPYKKQEDDRNRLVERIRDFIASRDS